MGSSARNPEVIRFADCTLDLHTAELRRNRTRLILQDQPFQILTMLLESPGQLVTREELTKKLWPNGTFVDFDQSLNKAVARLREALGDDAEHPRFVETLPRRGYRFIGRPEPLAAIPTEVPPVAYTPPHQVVPPAAHTTVSVNENIRRRDYFRAYARPAALGLAALLIAFGTLFYQKRPAKLTTDDTIIIAEFNNRTGDGVFDETLRQALVIQLGQSPFLNIFPDTGIQETLRYMGRSSNERVTSLIAGEICERRGIKGIVTGSISSMGLNYEIALEAQNCITGEILGQQLVEVQAKEDVLKGLEKGASALRAQLGESLSSIEKFDTPLEQATTSSLEALQAYSFATQKLARGGDTWDTLPFLKRAVELDPKFAMAHARLGEIYSSGGPTSNDELAKDSLEKAFALRDRVTERERLYLVSTYYENATRELAKAVDSYELWKWTFPRDVTPFDGLAGIYLSTGQFEKAADNAQRALQLQPKRAISYERLAGIHTYLNRLDEAKAFCHQSAVQQIDGPRIHWKLYMIAHLEKDLVAMEKELEWARNQGETTRVPFYQALAAAANGQLRHSEAFFQKTMDVRLADHDPEGAALAAVQLALIEAHFGYRAQAHFRAITSLRLLTGNRDLGSLALAVAGDAPRAKGPLARLQEAFPQDTFLNNVVGAVIAAQIELNQDRPKRAIELLRSTEPYELGADNAGRGFMAIYLRGQADLRLHAGENAVTEFQKIIDHPGIDPFSPLHALAYLGRARAYALQNDKTRTREAYSEFFMVWKEADPDLPILRQAKAEYAKL